MKRTFIVLLIILLCGYAIAWSDQQHSKCHLAVANLRKYYEMRKDPSGENPTMNSVVKMHMLLTVEAFEACQR